MHGRMHAGMYGCMQGWWIKEIRVMQGWRIQEIRAGQERGTMTPYPTQDKEAPSPCDMGTSYP